MWESTAEIKLNQSEPKANQSENKNMRLFRKANLILKYIKKMTVNNAIKYFLFPLQ